MSSLWGTLLTFGLSHVFRSGTWPSADAGWASGIAIGLVLMSIVLEENKYRLCPQEETTWWGTVGHSDRWQEEPGPGSSCCNFRADQVPATAFPGAPLAEPSRICCFYCWMHLWALLADLARSFIGTVFRKHPALGESGSLKSPASAHFAQGFLSPKHLTWCQFSRLCFIL